MYVHINFIRGRKKNIYIYIQTHIQFHSFCNITLVRDYINIF